MKTITEEQQKFWDKLSMPNKIKCNNCAWHTTHPRTQTYWCVHPDATVVSLGCKNSYTLDKWTQRNDINPSKRLQALLAGPWKSHA